VVPQAVVDQVDTLADTFTSRATIIGLSQVASGHIKSARNMMGE